MWDGTLSGEEFQLAAEEFLKLWNNHDSNTYQWSWQECSYSSARGYLILEDVVLDLGNDEGDDEEEDDVEEEENSPDPATLTNLTRQSSRCTYHVIYNESYRVPNIFFRGYHSDGRPMNWMDVRMSLPSQFAQQVAENKWTFLTQEEHPYLHRPWFMLHPCGTSSIMALIFSERTKHVKREKLHMNLPTTCKDLDTAMESRRPGAIVSSREPATAADQYLLAWLSFVGPVVRLPMHLHLFKSLN